MTYPWRFCICIIRGSLFAYNIINVFLLSLNALWPVLVALVCLSPTPHCRLGRSITFIHYLICINILAFSPQLYAKKHIFIATLVLNFLFLFQNSGFTKTFSTFAVL